MLASSKIKRLNKEVDRFLKKPPALTPEDQEIKKKCESSLYFFMQHFWHLIEPVQFVHGWHIKKVADVLQQCLTKWEVTELLMSFPPRHSKTSMLSMSCAWAFTTDPALKFAIISADETLAEIGNVQSFEIVNSVEYQKFWPHLKIKESRKDHFSLKTGGSRSAFTPFTNILGRGFSAIYLDDPNGTKSIYSDKLMSAVNAIVNDIIPTRYNDENKRLLVVCQQRLSKHDVYGQLKSKDNPKRLEVCFPALLDDSRKNVLDERTEKGEALWPQKWSKEFFAERKASMSKGAFEAMYQQDPQSLTGGIFDEKKFRLWQEDEPPRFDAVILSVDTASVGESDTSCFTAMLAMGVFRDKDGFENVMIQRVFKERIGYTAQKQVLEILSRNYMADVRIVDGKVHLPKTYDPKKVRKAVVLLEMAATGHALKDDIFHSGKDIKLVEFIPKQYGIKYGTTRDGKPKLDASKTARAKIAASHVDAGLVWLPADKDGKLFSQQEKFMRCVRDWPDVDSRDVIDCFSQGMLWLFRTDNLNYHGQEERAPYPF